VDTPDNCHPPLLLDFTLTLGCHRIPLTPHRSYAEGDYVLLYNILRHSDWSCVLNENSIDSPVNNLTAIVPEAITLDIPYIKSKILPFFIGFPMLSGVPRGSIVQYFY
jgi:hypothetical protein